MAPFMVNQQTNVVMKEMSGLKSDKNIGGKRSLQEMSIVKDVHRPAEPMSGTIHTKVQLQMNGTQYVAENRNSNRGFGPFSKIRTNSLDEPDSKSSNDVTSDHLPGILPHSQVYGVDSKGILGFTLLSPSHTPITQNIYQSKF